MIWNLKCIKKSFISYFCSIWYICNYYMSIVLHHNQNSIHKSESETKVYRQEAGSIKFRFSISSTNDFYDILAKKARDYPFIIQWKYESTYLPTSTWLDLLIYQYFNRIKLGIQIFNECIVALFSLACLEVYHFYVLVYVSRHKQGHLIRGDYSVRVQWRWWWREQFIKSERLHDPSLGPCGISLVIPYE